MEEEESSKSWNKRPVVKKLHVVFNISWHQNKVTLAFFLHQLYKDSLSCTTLQIYNQRPPCTTTALGTRELGVTTLTSRGVGGEPGWGVRIPATRVTQLLESRFSSIPPLPLRHPKPTTARIQPLRGCKKKKKEIPPQVLPAPRNNIPGALSMHPHTHMLSSVTMQLSRHGNG